MFIGEMKVKGRVLFQDLATFNFGDVGLTVVHGLNLNGGSKNTNAAGKSLLMSTLQDLVYRDVLVGSKRDRVTEGSVSLEFGKNREDTQRLILSRKKLQVHKDGKSLEIHKQEDVDSMVKGILPATIEAYSTLIHLDNRVPHPLIRGETDARKKFFTKFFELDTTDPLRKLVTLELAEIKSSGKLLTDKKTRHAHLIDSKQNTAELRKKLSVLRNKRIDMQTTIDAYQEDAALRQFVTEHKVELEKGSVPDLVKLSKKIKAIGELIEKAESYADYSAELKSWKKSAVVLRAYLTEHHIVDPISEQTACKLAVREWSAHVRETEDLNDEIAQVRRQLKDLAKPEDHDDTSGVCDKCGAVLTGKLLAQHERAVQNQKDKYVAKRLALRTYGKSLKKKLSVLQAPANDIADTEQRVKVLAGIPKELDKPDKPDGYGEDDTDQDISELRVELKRLTAIKEKLYWTRNALYAKAVEIPSLEAFIDAPDPTASYMKLIDQLSDVSVAYELSKKSDAEIAELEEFINEAETAATKAEALIILEKAYGTRGIRKVLINTVCQRLEEVLNSYSKALLPEDYVFKLEMDTQFRIEVTRNGSLPSDVRRLSGAESSLFSLLLWAGLMSFVPKKMRPNVLILDELDANMSEETKERFCEFIPKLLGVVEHVVVVTPQSDVRYEDYVPNVKYVTVVKKGLTAKIIKGKASDINLKTAAPKKAATSK